MISGVLGIIEALVGQRRYPRPGIVAFGTVMVIVACLVTVLPAQSATPAISANRSALPATKVAAPGGAPSGPASAATSTTGQALAWETGATPAATAGQAAAGNGSQPASAEDDPPITLPITDPQPCDPSVGPGGGTVQDIVDHKVYNRRWKDGWVAWPDCLPLKSKMAAVVKTEADKAYFWTGGAYREAAGIADQFHGTTLEQAIDRSGITMPQFGTPRTQESIDAWTFISRSLANQASGTAHVIVGNPPRQNNVAEVDELPTLKANPSVRCVIEINANTKAERTLFNRPESSARQCLLDRAREWATVTCPIWEHQPWPRNLSAEPWPVTQPEQGANGSLALVGGQPLTQDDEDFYYNVTPTLPSDAGADHLSASPSLVAHFPSSNANTPPDYFYLATNANDVDRSLTISPQDIGCQPYSPILPSSAYRMSFPTADAQQILSIVNETYLREYGLPSDSNLSDFIAAQHNTIVGAGLPDLGAPPAISGITASATSTGLAIVFPATSLPQDVGKSVQPQATGQFSAAARAWEGMLGLAATTQAVTSCWAHLTAKNLQMSNAVDVKRQVCATTATMLGSIVASDFANSRLGVGLPAGAWSTVAGKAGANLLRNAGLPNYLDPLVEDTWEWMGRQANNLNRSLASLSTSVKMDWTKDLQQTLANALSPSEGWLSVWNSFAASSSRTKAIGRGHITDKYLSGGPWCINTYYARPNVWSGDSASLAICANAVDQQWTRWSTNALSQEGLCLDITNASQRAKAPLEVYDCNGQWQQQWRESGVGEPIPNFPVLVNPKTHLCIDVPKANTTLGTQLWTNWCYRSPHAAEGWVPPTGTNAPQPVPMPGVVQDGNITSGLANKCAAALNAGDKAQPGQSVDLNDCNDQPAQDWGVNDDDTILMQGLCLAVSANAITQLQNCDNGTDQQWLQLPNGSLQNRSSGLCLDDPGATTTNGTQLTAEACDGGQPDQQWHLPGWTGGPLPKGPVCDIYRAGGTPCGIAVSMTRVLVSGYTGPLYQVQRIDDSALKDIGSVEGGYGDAAAQDAFCGSRSCVVNKIYDQTANHNDLTLEVKGPHSIGTTNHRADAKALPVMLDGHKVYGLKVSGAVGYRNNHTTGIATGTSPEGMYMVTSGTYNNSSCCFDFGNAETDTADHQAGTMDALNFGTKCYFEASGCSGSGPWPEADLEDGLFNGGDGNNTNNKGNSSNFVTAVLKNAGGGTDAAKDKYALSGGDAQGGQLSHWYEGPLPNRVTSGSYKTMRLQGGVVLGTGGDNSNGSIGAFFEGVMTQGYPDAATDDAVQANIVAAKYTGDSKGLPIDPGTLGEGAEATASQAVVHQGYTSVFTADPANGHLTENFLTHMGQAWQHQDLSAKFGIPAIMPGTQPVTLMHDGYLSVFTVAANSGHIWQSWIHLIGEDWQKTDLATEGTPPTDQTPTAVLHDGYASMFSVDAHRDLHETYLRFIGDTWHDLNLSGNGCARLLPGTGPVALFHSGYTSIFYAGPDRHLQECYFSGIGAPLAHHDLFSIGGAPLTDTTPGAAVHDGYTSVFTTADPSQHLWETYIAAIGAPWVSHDLSGGDTKVTVEPTPNVSPGTHPVAMYHGGYTSVFTVNENTQDVQETFLTDIGDPWHSQDFTAKFGTKTTVTTPIPLLHPDEAGNTTFASVFYVSEFSDHLQESYTPAIGVPWVNHDLTTEYKVPPVLVEAPQTNEYSAIHDGYTSVFTINNKGHLIETFLTAMGRNWDAPQDLTDKFGVPISLSNTIPVTVVHDGITSVFTVNGDNMLQESWVTAIGQPWHSKTVTSAGPVRTFTSVSAVYHAGYTSVYTVAPDGQLKESYFSAPGAAYTTINLPGPKVEEVSSPAAVVHSGWVSVFTIDTNQHLQQDYLSAIGDAWVNQDLTAQYGVPVAQKENSPAAVVHQGWTSVYTVDDTKHLQETYLRNIGDAWVSQDLTANFGAPLVRQANPPVPLYHTGYTSIYTVRDNDGHVVETYLPAIGMRWGNQDLTSRQGAPVAAAAPSALLHYDDAGGLTATSVFTIEKGTGDLWDSYLHGIGEQWVSKKIATF